MIDVLLMSHFSKIKTSLKDLNLLQKSLSDLGVSCDENINTLIAEINKASSLLVSFFIFHYFYSLYISILLKELS